MIIRETCYARSGLIGNPSDIFNGKVISFLFDAFKAQVMLYETPELRIVPTARDVTRFLSLDDLVRYRRTYGYYGGIRIIEAILVRFKQYCDLHGIELARRNFTIEYDSDVPFGLGLGGSSTIIKAVFAALMRFYELTERDIPKPIQPNIIQEAETAELGISAGPQDRVVAVYGGLVYMDFTREAWAANESRHGTYRNLDPRLLPPLFIAYKDELSKSSGEVHNIMRYRASVEHDARVLEAMAAKAALVDEAVASLEAGRGDAVGTLMSRDFDLRRSVYTLSPQNVRMIEIAREHGSHANFSGSGGAAVGICGGDDQYGDLEKAYAREGYRIIRVRIAADPAGRA
jgi:glucuronokinase